MGIKEKSENGPHISEGGAAADCWVESRAMVQDEEVEPPAAAGE